MKIGIPKEVKVEEHRVSATPGSVHMLVDAGHDVLVESDAGKDVGFSDADYRDMGAKVVPEAADAWSADMVIKVKEPVPAEYDFLRPDLLLFTFLHLAANRELTDKLLASQTAAVAYETVKVGTHLPLLEPMSEIAGRMSTLVGAQYLSKTHGGQGILLGGVPGVLPGKVVVLGGGTAGTNACRMAVGLSADVTILEVNIERMRYLDLVFHSDARTLFSNTPNLISQLSTADLLIGAVLIPGAKAPKLVRPAMLDLMKPGSVFVDIAIDQGGCSETSRPTTHDDPVYVEHGVTHYCVTNMPGAYARTATQALTNATMPYALKLATLGLDKALEESPELQSGLNTRDGNIAHPAVANAYGQ